MADTLLSEDAFNNEQSQKLFEVIDELQSCGAKAYVDLPEVFHETLESKLRILIGTDRHCWGPVRWEIVSITELDRYSLSRGRPPMYKVSDPNYISSYTRRAKCNQNIH